MGSAKQLLVNLVAALAAREAPRRSGIEAFIPAMLLLAPVLGIPVFAILLTILRVATLDHPLVRQPYLPLGLDSLVAGLIIAAQMVQAWRGAIEARMADYDRLPPELRSALRLRSLVAVLATSIVGLVALLLVLRN
jgi:hypothetical protein